MVRQGFLVLRLISTTGMDEGESNRKCMYSGVSTEHGVEKSGREMRESSSKSCLQTEKV